MKTDSKPIPIDTKTINLLPRWVISVRDEVFETVSFSSGAALAMLYVVLSDPRATLPGALLRDRMALDAAVACLKLENRHEMTSDIRDALCLARAGDVLGPAGDMFLAWRKFARINLGASGWKDRVKKIMPGPVTEMIATKHVGSPVAQAAQVLADALRAFPRQEAVALMLADLTLARAVGWDRAMPLLATHLPRKDIRAIGDAQMHSELSVHRAIIAGCDSAIRSAADLSRRAVRLQAIAPKLRAKGADAALALFLTHDAVSPSGMLSPQIRGTSVAMTDRAARRLCDRLVALNVVHELTGRSTFRLYGL